MMLDYLNKDNKFIDRDDDGSLDGLLKERLGWF